MVSRWVATCEVTVLLFVAPCNCTVQDRDRNLKSPASQAGVSYVGNSLSCPNYYCCFWGSTWKKVNHINIIFSCLPSTYFVIWEEFFMSALFCLESVSKPWKAMQWTTKSDTLKYLEIQLVHVYLQGFECNVIFHVDYSFFIMYIFTLYIHMHILIQ